MPRLFSGLSLPDPVKDQIADLRQPIPGTRWIDANDLHLTLRFAGDMDNRLADEFAHAVNEITHIRVFNMRLKGLGTFGNRDPRLIWAGVEAGPELKSLFRAHEAAARAAGLPPERRAFHPHITIARLRHPRVEALAKFLQRNAGFQTKSFLISHATLFSAKPKTGGGPYVVEQNIPLAGALALSENTQGLEF